jgi:hypothetical protein
MLRGMEGGGEGRGVGSEEGGRGGRGRAGGRRECLESAGRNRLGCLKLACIAVTRAARGAERSKK